MTQDFANLSLSQKVQQQVPIPKKVSTFAPEQSQAQAPYMGFYYDQTSAAMARAPHQSFGN